MQISDALQMQKGQRVRVCSGEKEPPRHHNRKHEVWRLQNYVGYVHRVEADGKVAVDKDGAGVMCFIHPASIVEPI